MRQATISGIRQANERIMSKLSQSCIEVEKPNLEKLELTSMFNYFMSEENGPGGPCTEVQCPTLIFNFSQKKIAKMLQHSLSNLPLWFGSRSENFYLKEADQKRISELIMESGEESYEIRGLRYGVAVHYGAEKGKKNYLRLVENLFQTRKLKYVFATGSLSYGINMPTSNVVFIGNSNFLTGMMFRQCAGRAGRRGHGAGVGNIYFAGFRMESIMRKMCLAMDALSPQLSISPSFLLRLTIMSVRARNHDKEWVDRLALRVLTNPLFRALISNPTRRYNFEQALVHSCFFSWSFFYERGYLKANGRPMMKCDLPIRIHYLEPECFILTEMITDCFDNSHSVSTTSLLALVPNDSPSRQELNILDMDILAILDYTLGRGNLQERNRSAAPYLLPDVARQVWNDYSANVFEQYTGYMRALGRSIPEEAALPLASPTTEQRILLTCPSDISTGSDLAHFTAWARAEDLCNTEKAVARAPLAGLSGYGDHFTSVMEMMMCGKEGVYASTKVIPSSDPTKYVLNRIYQVYTKAKIDENDPGGKKALDNFSLSARGVRACIELMSRDAELTTKSQIVLDSFLRVIDTFEAQLKLAKNPMSTEVGYGILCWCKRDKNGRLYGRVKQVDNIKDQMVFIPPGNRCEDFDPPAYVQFMCLFPKPGDKGPVGGALSAVTTSEHRGVVVARDGAQREGVLHVHGLGDLRFFDAVASSDRYRVGNEAVAVIGNACRATDWALVVFKVEIDPREHAFGYIRRFAHDRNRDPICFLKRLDKATRDTDIFVPTVTEDLSNMREGDFVSFYAEECCRGSKIGSSITRVTTTERKGVLIQRNSLGGTLRESGTNLAEFWFSAEAEDQCYEVGTTLNFLVGDNCVTSSGSPVIFKVWRKLTLGESFGVVVDISIDSAGISDGRILRVGAVEEDLEVDDRASVLHFAENDYIQFTVSGEHDIVKGSCVQCQAIQTMDGKLRAEDIRIIPKENLKRLRGRFSDINSTGGKVRAGRIEIVFKEGVARGVSNHDYKVGTMVDCLVGDAFRCRNGAFFTFRVWRGADMYATTTKPFIVRYSSKAICHIEYSPILT